MTYQPLFYNPGSIPPTMASKSGKNAIKYYILLKDIVGFEKKKSRVLRTESLEQYRALMGEIFYKEEKKNEFDEHVFVSAENQDRYVNCTEENFKPLQSRQFKILIAIPSKIERMYLLNSEGMLKKIMNIEKGDIVDVELNNPVGSKTVPGGKIAFVGKIQGKTGEYFGIRFEEPFGDCDGSIDRETHFHAQPKHGTFVSADKIKNVTKKKDIIKEHLKRQKSNDNALKQSRDNGQNGSNGNPYNTKSQNYSSMPAYSEALKQGKKDSRTKSRKGRKAVESVGDEHGGHQVNTRVVYFDEDGREIHGLLKFLGYLKLADDTIWAVVETDEKFPNEKAGSACKHLKEFKVLKIQTNHALVVLPEELMKEENFYGEMQELKREKEGTTKVEQCKPRVSKDDSNKDQQETKKLYENEFKKDFLKGQQDIEMKSLKEPKNTDLSNLNPILTINAKGASSLHDQIRDDHSKNNAKVPCESSSNEHHHSNKVPEIYESQDACNVDFNQPVYAAIDELQKPIEKSEDPKPSRGVPSIYAENTTQLQGSNAYETTEYLQKEFQENILRADLHKHSVNVPSQVDNVQSQQPEEAKPKIELGMMVEVIIKEKPYYGCVKWLGTLDIKGKMVELAGLEMETYEIANNSGSFLGQKYFDCPEGKGFFAKTKVCKVDRRFGDATSKEDNFNIDRANKALPPRPKEDVPLTGYLPPATELKKRKHLGRMKGIQGHHNSCYMDSTLFAMFSFTDAFDAALLRERKDDVTEDYMPAQKILKEEIVNPLRQNGFVQSASVMNLRKILNKHAGKLGGFMTEEKDPEELVVLLFEKVIPMEPLIGIKTPNAVNRSLLYQIFPPKPDYDLPTVQDLLTLSLIDTDLLLNEIPPVMVLQMPRFGTQKMCERIFINPQLDLTHILYTSEKLCHVCNERASCMCKDCSGKPKPFGAENRNAFLCKHCMELSHRHPDRAHHKWNEIELCKEPIKYDKDSLTMELFAVVCINTSHYVSFVKCGDGDREKWVFFDSMADREGGDSDGYNIPEVAELPDLKKHLKDEKLVKGLKKEMHNKNNERLLRFFEDASLCMYRSKEYLAYQ